jgi:hypothetical protein
VDEQFTKSSSGYVEVDDCELQTTGNVLISGSGITTIIGNKINNLVVNNAGAQVLIKGADDCVMPQVTAGTLNIVDSIIRASSNTANAVTASAGTVVTLMNDQIVTPAADNVARVSIAGYHSIISLVYDKANSTLSNSLNSVVYFQTANVDSLVSSGNISVTGNISSSNISATGTTLTGIAALTVGVTNTLLPNTVASFSANVNNYTQVTLQNKSSGADATADFVITANNGSDTVNYADFGIINSGYDNTTPTNSLGNIVFAADTYLYAQGNASNAAQPGGNIAIGTTVSGKTVKIFAGGANSTAIVGTFSNTGLAVNGNVTATNLSGNISITGNVTGTSPNVTLVAGAYSTVFDNTGNTTFANGAVSLTTLSATGNITSGNIVTTGNVSGNTAGFAIGYRDIPQVSFTGNATITTSDAGKHYYSTLSTSNVLTIANNTSQSFQVGAAITIVNQGTGNITVAQGSGVTLYVAGNATSGNRTVTTFGMATIIKVATNTWFINGTGVS